MTHVCDVTETVTVNSIINQEAEAKLVGSIFTQEESESLIFNRVLPRNSITTVWTVMSSDYSISPPTLIPTMITLSDTMSRDEAELIVCGKRSTSVSDASSRALRIMCDITRRLQYLEHPNRLEYHQRRVIRNIEGTLIQQNDLMSCLRMCRYWTIAANAAAAKRIHDAFGGMSIMYRQSKPEGHKTHVFQKYVKASHRINIDFTSKRSIRDSMYSQTDPHEIKKLSLGITRLTTSPMYILANDAFTEKPLDPDYGHWNHDERFYTNYTNPISRYIDIVIQRLIIAALSPLSCVFDTAEHLRMLCQKTNKMRHEQQKARTIVSTQEIAFDMEKEFGRIGMHVFVKGLTVEKDKAYVNFECLDPNIKLPISTLLLSATAKGLCTIASLQFNPCEGSVIITPRTGCRNPVTIGLMNEMYVVLQQINAKIVACIV